MIPRILWLVYGYLLVFLTGGSLLMTLFVAPTLFARLGVQKAGETVSALFPGYFHLLFTGALVEVILLGILSRLSSRQTKPLLWGWAGGLFLAGALALYLGPHALELKRLHDLMPGDPSRAAAFATAHRITFIINVILLLGLLGATLSLLSHTVILPEGKALPERRPESGG